MITVINVSSNGSSNDVGSAIRCVLSNASQNVVKDHEVKTYESNIPKDAENGDVPN